MNLALLVGFQSVLYALLWAGASLWLRRELQSTLLWMGYALVAGVAFILIGLRPYGPLWLTHTGACVCHVLGLVFARYGVEVFFHVRPRYAEYFATLFLGGVTLVAIGPDDETSRIALTSLLSALLLLGAILSCWSPLRAEFGGRFGLVVAVPIAALLLVNLKLARNALQGLAGCLDPAGAEQAMVWSVTLVAAAAFNFLFLFLLGTRMQRSLSRMASPDPLTGILNRRGMQSLLQAEWQRSQRYATPFAVISLDVDFFKRVNDTHGHGAGDKVLVAVASLLGKEVRDTDCVQPAGVWREPFGTMLLWRTHCAALMLRCTRASARAAIASCYGVLTCRASCRQAQWAQMQALLTTLSGKRDSNSALNVASVHQQCDCFCPVVRSISIAHWLGWPHSGHTSGGNGVRAVMMSASVATAAEK